MNDKGKDTLKIINQFRDNRGMGIDLKCEGALLSLLVAPRRQGDDAGEWRVEARAGRAARGAHVVTEWGHTRSEALQAVGRTWASKELTHNLPMFDWEAIAEVLTEVRAL